MKLALLFPTIAFFAGDGLLVSGECDTTCAQKGDTCNAFIPSLPDCCDGFGLSCTNTNCLTSGTQVCPTWLSSTDSLDLNKNGVAKSNTEIKILLDSIGFCPSGKSPSDALVEELLTRSGSDLCLSCYEVGQQTEINQLRAGNTFCVPPGLQSAEPAEDESTSGGVGPVAAGVSILAATGSVILQALLG